MKTKALWMLLGLNLGLGLMLVWGALPSNAAMAQRVVRPNDYLLIPGDLSNTDQGVVYILDTSTGAMGAMTYEDTNRRLVTMPPLDLNRVFSGQSNVR